MAATNISVVLDLADGETKLIYTIEEMDRHIRAMQKARQWLAGEIARRAKNK